MYGHLIQANYDRLSIFFHIICSSYISVSMESMETDHICWSCWWLRCLCLCVSETHLNVVVVQACDSQQKLLEEGRKKIRQNRAQRARLRAARLSSLRQEGETGHRATARTQSRGQVDNRGRNLNNTVYIALDFTYSTLHLWQISANWCNRKPFKVFFWISLSFFLWLQCSCTLMDVFSS